MDWSTRRQSLFGLTITALLFGFVGVWGSFASLAGAVIAAGQIEPEARSQVVQHQDGGIVARILVRNGDRVAAGDPVLELDGGTLGSQSAIVTGQITGLRAETARLAAEELAATTLVFPEGLRDAAAGDAAMAATLGRQQSVFAARLATYTGTVKSLRTQQEQKRAEIEGLQLRSAALHDQRALVSEQLVAAQDLQAKGLMPASAVLELRRAERALDGEIAGVAASAAAAASEIARLDVEVERLASARQEEAAQGLRDVQNRLAELEEQKRDLERRIGRLVLRAPLAGIVHELQVYTLGAVIRPADPVLHIIPQEGDLTVIAKIDGAHVDSVRTGQAAKLRFTSFDSQMTPELAATVARVSAGATLDQRSGASYYTAELAIAEDQGTLLDGKPLLPGMPVEVYIQTGERSPLQYVLKPFLDYVERAFRE